MNWATWWQSMSYQDPIFDDLEIHAPDGIEYEADQIAQSMFIPQEDWEEF